jgi:hypothetical protein
VDDLLEPFRTFIDLAVIYCLNHHSNDLNKITKELMTQQLNQTIRWKTQWTSVENCMKMMAQSLANCYKNNSDVLQLPKPNYNKLRFEFNKKLCNQDTDSCG